MRAGEDFLSRMGRASESRARRLAAGASLDDLRRRAQDMPPAPALRLSAKGFDIIAEIKMNSPSAGTLSSKSTDIESRAEAYAAAGACAVSVLTEPDRFGGSMDHLQRAAAVLETVGVPAMAKDFLVAPEQICAARIAGAGGVLLIVRMLDDDRLAELLELSLEMGLFVLLEAFDQGDLERTASLVRRQDGRTGTVLLGLNCRDLRTLQVKPGRFQTLASEFPKPFPRVAESGIEVPEDAARVASMGYSVALVGTALMRSPDPAALLGGMIRKGRSAAGAT